MSVVAVRSRRRWLLWLGLAFFLALGATVLARRPITGAAIAAALRMAGAGEVQFDVTRSSPWAVELTNLGFSLRTQRFDARRVTLERTHWWAPSLGVVRIEGAKLPVAIDGSGTNPWSWATYSGGPTASPTAALSVPVEEVSVDGVLVVGAAGQSEQEVRVQLAAKQAGGSRWTGNVRATAPGFATTIEGAFDIATNAGQFRASETELDLDRWQGFISQMVVLPGGRWEMAGHLRGSAAGTYAEGKLKLAGEVELREGRFGFPERNVTASGVSAKFTFTDIDKLISEPGQVRVATLSAGEIQARNLELRLAFDTMERIAVQHATLEAFGGRVATEPFKFFPHLSELEAVLLVDGLAVEQLLALAKDVPAQATGLVDGRVPLRIDGSGIRLGTGWLELKRGAYAEVKFNAEGLLTRGAAPSSAQYAVLKKIEGGLLRLRLSALRLDIRPPKAPVGRSAVIHLVGEPVDPEVKAPVTLDLNVNGPLESLLNLGLNNRVSFGAK